jgi:3-phytase
MNVLPIVSILASQLSPGLGGTRPPAFVEPTVETAPVPSTSDAADDAVFWVHPSDPALSTVIATDKDSGIAVYDLAGNQLQFVPDGQLNNVDLRHLAIGSAKVPILMSAERGQNALAFYTVDPTTRGLLRAPASPIVPRIPVYGSCMYRSPRTGDLYCFVTSKTGEVQQYLLSYDAVAGIGAVLAREFDVGGQVEGCVADDEAGTFFIGEEAAGIWRYDAEPQAGTARVQVDTTGPGGHLVPDVEGLAIYYSSGGEGYLLASSQGNNSYAVYERRPPHRFLLTFQIGDNARLGIDGTTDTDGIDVMNLGLGSPFPGGAFIAQDSENPGANQNFKLVPWPEIAAAASPPLIVDPTYVP